MVLFHQLLSNANDQVDQLAQSEEETDRGVDALEECGCTGAGGSDDRGAEVDDLFVDAFHCGLGLIGG